MHKSAILPYTTNMEQIISPSSVHGCIPAPSSKSVAQRAIALASLAKGNSQIWFPGECDDVKAAINVCSSLGAVITQQEHVLHITGGIHQPSEPLHCGEAGLGIRMFAAIAATLPGQVVLSGSGSLAARPMKVIEDSLLAMGVKCSTLNGKIPVTTQGPFQGGKVHIHGGDSSQVLTGILMASPLASKNVEIIVDSLKSIPYVELTMQMMRDFGVKVSHQDYKQFFIEAPQNYQPAHYTVEGDWSGAAFMLVAGAIGGRITLTNLNADSAQADKKILEALRSAGAQVHISQHEVTISKAPLKAFDFDATHCPDLFPPLVALAAWCEGQTSIRGVERLRIKESDRAATLSQEFSKMGLPISIENDIMHITGTPLRGATVHSHHDHRITMACAIATLPASSNTLIQQAQAVNKSYPDFFEKLKAICQE